jgi:hypothetical protein
MTDGRTSPAMTVKVMPKANRVSCWRRKSISIEVRTEMEIATHSHRRTVAVYRHGQPPGLTPGSSGHDERRAVRPSNEWTKRHVDAWMR